MNRTAPGAVIRESLERGFAERGFAANKPNHTSIPAVLSGIRSALDELEKSSVPAVRAITNRLRGDLPRQGGAAGQCIEKISRSTELSILEQLLAISDRLNDAIDALKQEISLQSDVAGVSNTQDLSHCESQGLRPGPRE